MIVISAINLRRGSQFLLEQASATVNPGQKVGLVGKNGSGKSTLLALIKGEVALDAGDIVVPQHWSVAWVNQETPALQISALDYVIDGDRVFRELEQKLAAATQANDGYLIGRLHDQLQLNDAWSIQSRAATLLTGLGFENEKMSRPVSSFSGGWRMRLNLAQALICRSDLLLLDEPTNHLDLDAVIWLEKWLKNYPGTLILISHDREFLDPIVGKIIQIEQQKLNEFTGNYSDFERQRTAQLAQQQALYLGQQEKVAHLQNYIDRFRAKATKAKQAQSRIKMLERMELIAPAHVDSPFSFQFRPSSALPNPLLKLDNVSAGYGDNTVLSSIKLNLVPGSRIGLLGRNGAGKSTLIKLLAGSLQPQKGEVQLSKGVVLGYFAQHQLELLQPDASPLLHMMRLSPQETEQNLRDYLGSFAFKGDKVTTVTEKFSGGEKARLVLAMIIWQRPNLLLLDEPTNHLDLVMRQSLTTALLGFDGALLVVSHDRHLLRTTTDELYLVNAGKVVPFDGDLDDYQQWLLLEQTTQEVVTVADSVIKTKSVERKEQKRLEAEFRQLTQPIRQKLNKTEQVVTSLTEKLRQIEQRLSQSELYEEENKRELQDCLQQQIKLSVALEQQENSWLELQEELETMTQQFDQEGKLS